jgi:hypothetical protein
MNADVTPMNADEADMNAACSTIGDGLREGPIHDSARYPVFIGVHRRSSAFPALPTAKRKT